MKRPILALLLVLGILFYSSCQSTPKDVKQNESEEVQTDTLNYAPMEEDEGLNLYPAIAGFFIRLMNMHEVNVM